MNRGRPLPANIAERLTPLSDVDVAVYCEEGRDLDECRLAALECTTRHLATDEVDVVVLNHAPSALLARLLPGRRVILDREPFRRRGFESLEARKAADFRVFERRLLERRFGCG